MFTKNNFRKMIALSLISLIFGIVFQLQGCGGVTRSTVSTLDNTDTLLSSVSESNSSSDYNTKVLHAIATSYKEMNTKVPYEKYII